MRSALRFVYESTMSLNFELVRQKMEEERAQLLARSIPPPELAKGDEADLAAMAQVREQAHRLAADQKNRLAQIDQALARIAAGTYGICAACGKPIGDERMEAIPYAVLCITCQSKQEKKKR